MGSRVGGFNSAALPADKALAGVPRLLDDLQRLSEDTDSADIVFILGREEERVSAHRVILMARCKSFQTAKRGEVCRIPGSSVSPTTPGTPTPIRLPQAPPDTFKQFLLYIYTGKILLQDSSVFEMLALAQELGVDELRNACEDHVTSTLSVASACTFLAAAMNIQNRSPERGTREDYETLDNVVGINRFSNVVEAASLTDFTLSVRTAEWRLRKTKPRNNAAAKEVHFMDFFKECENRFHVRAPGTG
ncbi:hypothetical protein Zmor_006300 [Zophobas morio]|uniref:BTB domain-containing protein n=1 Tax=Zophobas morio TaxID=2755281 RepID=A0AA38MMQ0_9CUCU|nr:hypothetical protein Zmor_006300 [Zophobas morio]